MHLHRTSSEFCKANNTLSPYRRAYDLHEEPTANHLSDLFQEFNSMSGINK